MLVKHKLLATLVISALFGSSYIYLTNSAMASANLNAKQNGLDVDDSESTKILVNDGKTFDGQMVGEEGLWFVESFADFTKEDQNNTQNNITQDIQESSEQDTPAAYQQNVDSFEVIDHNETYYELADDSEDVSNNKQSVTDIDSYPLIMADDTDTQHSNNNAATVPLNTISPDTLKLFVNTLDLIRNDFIYPVNDDKLFFGAIDGMLKNVDPYAQFLDTNSYYNLQNFSEGDLADVGLKLKYSEQYDSWVVEAVDKDSPALGKLAVGNFVESINQTKLLKEHTNEDIEQLLQGIAGSMLTLKVSEKGRAEHKVKLQRLITADAQVSIKVQRSVAIVSIPTFQDNTKQQILDALVSLDRPILGLILDIRNNPGGILLSAADVAGLFADNIELIVIKKRNNEESILSTSDNQYTKSYLSGMPTVVLQNRYSASASEVLASGLQYNHLATVVGEVSYGKGTIQSVVPLEDEQAIKLTTAKYIQMNGEKINGVGVVPNVSFQRAFSKTSDNQLNDLWLSLAVDQVFEQLNKNPEKQSTSVTKKQQIEPSTNLQDDNTPDEVTVVTIEQNLLSDDLVEENITSDQPLTAEELSPVQDDNKNHKKSAMLGLRLPKTNAKVSTKPSYKYWFFTAPEY